MDFPDGSTRQKLSLLFVGERLLDTLLIQSARCPAQRGVELFKVIRLNLLNLLLAEIGHDKILDHGYRVGVGFGSGGPIRMPQSRHTKLILPAKLPDELQVLAKSQEVEAFLLATTDQKNLFITGHPEYDTRTLDREYKRDLEKGKPISKPNNYYQNNQIVNQWFQSSVKLYTNWLNLIHTT